MPLTRLAADAFGVVTIALVFLLALFGLYCICRIFYFQLRIQRGDFLQLGYFNGPWIIRIALVFLVIWWGFWEIGRLTLSKEISRPFSSLTWQKNACKFYILSNLGFAEPSMFLILIFLLRASLQKRESGTLNPRWNRKTVLYILIFCFPVLIMQCGLVFIGPKYNNKIGGGTKISKYFTDHTSLVDGDGNSRCTYPLFSTAFLGFFYTLLISYAVYIGAWLLSLVINKGLQQRIYWLISSLIILLPSRVILLGCSVFVHPASTTFEAIVFFAFFMMLLCASVSIWMLVYLPLADALALRDIRHIEIEGVPFNEYYQNGASLVASESLLESGRSSDSSIKPGSISFRLMVKDTPPMSEGVEESSYSYSGPLHISSPPMSSQSPPGKANASPYRSS